MYQLQANSISNIWIYLTIGPIVKYIHLAVKLYMSDKLLKRITKPYISFGTEKKYHFNDTKDLSKRYTIISCLYKGKIVENVIQL